MIDGPGHRAGVDRIYEDANLHQSFHRARLDQLRDSAPSLKALDVKSIRPAMG
jgi:hypothetical protein